MKIALVYDRVNKWGGAERVLISLHKVFPEATLYTAVYNEKKTQWAKIFKIHPSFLQKFPFASSHHDWYPYLMPVTFESFTFDEYDVVISVTSEAAKGILTRPETKHICICLTPTRYLWSGHGEYFKNPLFRFITKPIVTYLRIWDVIAAQRPDAFIAISKEVQRRIEKYYKRKSEVIYPAIELGEKRESGIKNHESRDKNKYFLVVSRLVPYKRVDLAIEACNALHLPLKIIGTGSEEKRLREIAGPTIEFLGNLTDDTIIMYYMACIALLFPGYEDLGLSILEAQKFGRPVIAYKAGGALETIVEHKTGKFFYPQTKQALIKTVKEFLAENEGLSPSAYNRKYKAACMKQGEKFTQKTFEKELRQFMEKVIQ